MYDSKLSCLEQSSVADGLHCVINAVNAPLWDWLVWILIGVGVFFTVATGCVQVRLFGRSVKEIWASRSNSNQNQGLSSFQAFVTGLASRVGTGNIAGVAIAITAGGPGAVFWMWMTAFIGMSSGFAESVLAQLYKVRDKQTGKFRGGPAYYIAHGLNHRGMSILFSVCLIVCCGFAYPSIQANTITQAMQSALGMAAGQGGDNSAWETYQYITAAGLVILTAPIIFGGMYRVAKASEIIVPIMAILYLGIAAFVVLTNLGKVPEVLALIFRDAFTFKAAGGGFLGGIISQGMLQGIKRGLYSNEAGQGTMPNAAAAADVKHPVSQGLVQMIGVFVDTMIVCTATAMIVLLSSTPNNPDLSGIQVTQAALETHIGAWAQQFLAVVLFVFAFSSIIGSYAFAETNVQYLHAGKKVITAFRVMTLCFVFWGAVAKVGVVWDLGDWAMGTITLINLVAIAAMYKMVKVLLKDYTDKIQQGQAEPEFKLAEHPELQDKIKSHNVW
ncbi:alanine:cation symporter family protein [Wielerella bovis]|uniref:alanine/glycine:cation symporter family protein n=1 Tax=Wielerella bovis TaxID=2917790 RepID=UPI00201894FE|nr:alanine/glycine:cation symporter family protein [Wielerella bovis]ULJ62480.1 alanine:cation symporter family protein [Wielerella bovis]